MKLPPEVAFNKGIDYFTEGVFFYAVLFGIAFYELNKAHKTAKDQKEKILFLTKGCHENQNKIDMMKTDVTAIRAVQLQNKKDIEELEAKSLKLEKILADRHILNEFKVDT